MSAQFNTAAVSALASAAARHVFDADAKHAASMQKAVGEVIEALRPLSGASTSEAVKAWAEVAGAFKAAYVARAEAKGSEAEQAKKAADQAWSRLTRGADLERPQTPEQKRAAELKRAQRAAELKRARRAADSADKSKPATPVEKAAKDLAQKDIVLSPAEFHLLSLVRSGSFAAASTMLADMARAATQTKPTEAVTAPKAPAVPKGRAKAKAKAPEAEAATV